MAVKDIAAETEDSGPSVPRTGAFTLVELLAVCVVIVLLIGMVLGMTAYIQRKAKLSLAKSELATLQAAIEQFKQTYGRCPTSTAYRISCGFVHEVINNINLLSQIAPYFPQNRTYIQPVAVLGTNLWYSSPVGLTFYSYEYIDIPSSNAIIDPWDRPWGYYCPYPAMTTNCPASYPNSGYPCYSNSVTIGGQKNTGSYDLWSCGPDRTAPTADDISNF